MAALAYKSAVCLIPPRHAWAAIQEIRVFTDKSFCRWPPHINLLYPFVEPTEQDQAVQLCREALTSTKNFQVTLNELDFFDHNSRSCTLFLRPKAEELLEVQAALFQAFPQCSHLSSDASRGIHTFTPHLSLGQSRTRGDVMAAQQQISASWEPITFQATGVCLISREDFDEPFRLQWWVPFGGGEPVFLNAPYCATVGESCLPALNSGDGGAAVMGEGSDSTTIAQQLVGIGAAGTDGSIYNFAYGANMCPQKLSGARGLHPLESLPAQLPGWRLAFTHRGGMGNLVQAAGSAGSTDGPQAVHGVLHRLSPADYAKLASMEHEYRPVEVEVQPYGVGPAVSAVAFVTPEDRCIADGLPPPQRYLKLLQEGAHHWQLDPAYTQWLDGLRSVDSKQRGPAYYTSAGGAFLAALPKIRTGSQKQHQRRQGPQGRRRRQQPTEASSN